MRILLDTHVLLWSFSAEELAPEVVSTIADRSNEVFVSTASVWEIVIKAQLGKLREPPNFLARVKEEFEELKVEFDHAWATRDLEQHHYDPFDRLIAAQAISEQLTLFSRDPVFRKYPVSLMAV